MAEVALILTAIGIVQTVAPIISSLKEVVGLITGVKKTPIEAKHIVNQLEAAKAILTSIKTSLETEQRSPDFMKLWGESARLVLTNIGTTLSEIQRKMYKRGLFGKKVVWSYEKPDALELQQTLQGYMQMLAIVQNGLLQTNLGVIHETAHRIENAVSDPGKSPLPLEGLLADTFKGRPPLSIRPALKAGPETSVLRIGTADGGDIVSPGRKKFKTLASWAVLDFHVGELKESSGLAEVETGNVSRELRTALGPGKVTVALNDKRTQLWVIYSPDKRKVGESRWYRPLHDHFRLESVATYDDRCKDANAWDFFHSNEEYISDRPGLSLKGVCLFCAGLQADTQDQSQSGGPGAWVEIALKAQSKNSKLLKTLGDDVEAATKTKAAADWAARMSPTSPSTKKK